MKQSTILVVDDELFFRRLYAEVLAEDGHRVETVSSGDEAVVRLRQGGFDLVITDMVMPGICGLELLRFCRGLDNPPDVLLVTGHATLESAIQALKSGARDYLIKPFDADELRHLVRTCLEQRRLLDENQLLKSQIRLFQRGQSLASLLETDRLLQQAVSTLRHELGEARGFAFLLAKEGETRVIGAEGLEDEEARRLALHLRPQLEDLSGLRVIGPEELEPAGAEVFGETLKRACLFPLHCQKELRGAMVLLNPPGRDLPHPLPHESLLFIAEQAALGFENAYRYQGAQELIYTDDLTGLYNYRFLQVALDQEIRRAERYGLEFALVFLDLDLFKGINDRFGHLAGSSVLREVAQMLRRSVREVDTVFRYGGDEFTALLVETDHRGAAVVAERMRETIASHPFLTDSGGPARLTATVGYACFPENASDKKSILHLADQAMYEGKKVRNVTRGAWDIRPR